MPMRHPMRRSLIVLATTAAMALLAAACGGDDGDDTSGPDGNGGDDVAAAFECPVGAHTEADGPTEITVWHAYNTATQATLEAIAAEYNDSQDDVTVQVEAQGTYEELLTKYETAIGDPATLPDVVFAEDTNLQFLIDSQTVIPAESCIDADDGASEFYDDVVASVANAYTVQDALWPAAFGVSMPILYVNLDHLRAAGLDPEDPPGTLEELRTAAEAIRDAGLPGMEQPIVMTTNSWFFENWLTGAGELIVDNANGRDGLATESLVDNDASDEVLEWMSSMAADGLLKALPHGGGFDQYFALARQHGSILIDGSRAITSIVAVIDSARSDLAGLDVSELDDADLQGLDVTVSPIAGIDEPGKGMVAGSAGYLVAGDDDASIAGAWDFLRFFNSTDNQVRWTLEGSYLPVTESAQQHPDLVDSFENDRAGQWLSVAYEQLRTLDADFPGPVMGPYKEFRSGMQAVMERVAEAGADPGTAIEEFDAEFQSALDAYAREVGG